MVQLSNRSIVYLLVIAMAITLASTVLNVSKLGYLGNMITGAATNTSVGTATLTVTSQTAVTMRVSSIAFGSGFVNTTSAVCTYCQSSTESGHASGNESCCSRFNNVTAGFFLENTGNENVTLNVTCSGSCTAAEFVNGTSPLFQFRVVNSSDGASTGKTSNNSADTTTDTTSSCSSGDGVGWNYSSWTNMAATGFDLCGSNATTEYYFGAQPTRNAVIMDILVKIPADAITALEKTATLTFSATSAG